MVKVISVVFVIAVLGYVSAGGKNIVTMDVTDGPKVSL